MTKPTEPTKTISAGGRKTGSVKISASARIAGLTDRMAAMIEKQITSLNRELDEVDKAREAAEEPYSAEASLARVEVSTRLAGLLKTLMQIQKLRSEAGEEDGDAAGASDDGEAIVMALLGEKRKI